jgi:hypothetical protein
MKPQNELDGGSGHPGPDCTMQRAHVRDRALGDSLRAGASWAAFNGRERLAEVVAYYGIALRQCGTEFLGRCPFCGCDPSLAVKPSAGTVRCTACKARYDAVGFIARLEGLDPKRARKRLAARVWAPLVPITYQTRAVSPRLKPARKKRLKEICGARNRRGTPCQCKQLLRGGRCKFHGGMSTGAKTPEGKARALRNLKPFRMALDAKR